MVTFPNAKINLGLNITEKRPDGYHNLETVFYPIPLEDALEVVVSDNKKEKITLYQSGITIDSTPDENLVTKAYRIIDKDFNLPPVDAYLYKRIPSGAGLGGGSSNASHMIKLLNDTFSLHLSAEEMEAYATTLGADCAFFIQNKPVFAEGIGNAFSPISLSLKEYRIVVVKPNVFIPTRDAFSLIKPHQPTHSLKDVITHPITEWKQVVKNDFEESVFPKHPIIRDIKEKLYEQGALYASMSGSGSSVFGIFNSEDKVQCEIFNNYFYFQSKFLY